MTGPGLNFRIEQRRVNSSRQTDATAAASSNLTVCDRESHRGARADDQGLEIENRNIEKGESHVCYAGNGYYSLSFSVAESTA